MLLEFSYLLFFSSLPFSSIFKSYFGGDVKQSDKAHVGKHGSKSDVSIYGCIPTDTQKWQRLKVNNSLARPNRNTFL